MEGSMSDSTDRSSQEKIRPFKPSVWGDFFVTYNNPLLLQGSEEKMREMAEELKGEVRSMFVSSKVESVTRAVTLVETLERLGIDNHFREEINTLLTRILNEEQEFGASADDLDIVAIRFRLLRQHGFRVSTDVFDKFKDDAGNLIANLKTNPSNLLSLYNAAHMATPSEKGLDEIIVTSRYHLEVMRHTLRPPMQQQVSRALEIPLPRTFRRLETMHYIKEYEQEENNNHKLLELARLDFELVRSLHLKELKALSMWWRDLYEKVDLRYARDRLVENYFWTCGVFHEEEYSRARVIFSKILGFLSLMDDTYDVHATLEDCHKLNEAIQRWDKSAAPILPEYLHVFYAELLSNFEQFEDTLETDEKYRVSYAKKGVQLLSASYLGEAIWSNGKYTPSFSEHLEVSVMSSGCPTLALVVLMGMGEAATKEAFDWAATIPDMVSASGLVARFLNDIASYKLGKTKKDVVSSVECYIKENGVTGVEALTVIAGLLEDSWRRINQECMEIDPKFWQLAHMVVNLTRTMEVIYLGGRDGYTFGGDIKAIVTALFLKPI